MIFRIDSLETGHHDDVPFLQLLFDFPGIHLEDPRLRVGTVRVNLDLMGQEGSGLVTHPVEGEGKQRDRDLFARGDQGIVLALVRLALRGLVGEPDEPVRLACHGRQHDDQVVSPFFCADDPLGHIPDFLQVGDGCPAVFLHDQRHEIDPPENDASRSLLGGGK